MSRVHEAETKKAGTERRPAASNKGKRKAAASAPSPGHTLTKQLGNHRTQAFAGAMKEPDAVQPGEVTAAIERRTSWLVKVDTSALGADLLAAAEGGRFSFCDAVLEELGPTDRDNVSLAFMKHLPADAPGERRLDALAASNAGRRLLDRLFDELTSGLPGHDEQQQADRIIDAKTRTVAGSKSKMIFPYRPPSVASVLSPDAPISARRLPDGRIWVKQPRHVHDTTEFSNEVRTLPPNLFISGIEIPENTIVSVKMYDRGGEVHQKPALYLVQLSNESDTKFAFEVAEVAAFVLPAGAARVMGRAGLRAAGKAGLRTGRAVGKTAVEDFAAAFVKKNKDAAFAGLFGGGVTKAIKKAAVISGGTSALANIYYQVKAGRRLRDLDVLAVIIEAVLGAVFGVVIAKVWKVVPLSPELRPIYIFRELIAKRPGPVLETIKTLVRQQMVLTPVSALLSAIRVVAFKKDPIDALNYVLVDAVAGAVASYFLQIAWLNKPGDLAARLLYRKIISEAARLETGWAAFSRSVLGQLRQAVIRQYMGLGPSKKNEKQSDGE